LDSGRLNLQDWRVHVLSAVVFGLLGVVLILGSLRQHDGILQGVVGVLCLLLASVQSWCAVIARRRAAAKKSG
jgi:lipopolysaccharide export LptBFGC system permease protein LptF